MDSAESVKSFKGFHVPYEGAHVQTDSITLNRLIKRLNDTLKNDPLNGPLHRSRYARTKFSAHRLVAQPFKADDNCHRRRHQSAITQRQFRIRKLAETLERLAQEDDGSYDDPTGEDLLGDGQSQREPRQNQASSPESQPVSQYDGNPDVPSSTRQAVTSLQQDAASTIRNRVNPSSGSRDSSRGTTSAFQPHPSQSLSDPSALLTDNTTAQTVLTSSLLNLAQSLKASSQAMSESLENEKSILSQTVSALDKNTDGMQAAGKRMGVLRRMSEGQGWWGRMMLYAWIGGLWLVAFLLVFIGPKLRF